MTKQDIIAALRGFISQRSGIEFANYGERESFMHDYRRILRHGKHARELLRIIESCESITADDILLRATAGRLEITEKDGRVRVDYCAGQYYCVEYRAAVCAFLAGILWRRIHADLAEGGKSVDGDAIRKRARTLFGRAIANAWFN